MASAGFDLQKFIADSIKTVVAPKSYFSGMAKSGGFVEPIIKAAIYGILSGVISFLWLKLGLGIGGGMLGAGTGITTLVTTVIGALIGLFIGGAIVLIFSLISGGTTDYEANVRAMAAMMVLMPVSSLLGFTYGINLYLGVVIGLVVNFYGLWLLLNALISGLSGKAMTAQILVGVLALLSIAGGLYSYKAMKALMSLGS